MPCTEAYKEHIMKTVIRYAALNAWRDRSISLEYLTEDRSISLEYLTEEKFYPLGTNKIFSCMKKTILATTYDN